MHAPVLLACLLIASGCLAQLHPFITYSPRDGLANSRVRGAYQDSWGRMYFMTYGGLSVYDGVRFRNYTVQDGLADDFINDVLEIGEDSILVATNTAALNLLSNGEIVSFPVEGEQIRVVNQFLKDDDGNIYMTSDYGFSVLNGNILRMFDLPFPDKTTPFLGSICDFGRHLIFTTNELRGYRGLYLFDKRSQSVVDVLPDIQVLFLEEETYGRVWINQGGQVLLLDTIALRNDQLAFADQFYSQSTTVAFATFRDHNRWWYDGKLGFLYGSQAAAHQANVMPLDSRISRLRDLFIDREYNLWICTDGSGVLKTRHPEFRIIDRIPAMQPDNGFLEVTATPSALWYTSLLGDLYCKTGSETNHIRTNNQAITHVIGEFDNKLYVVDTLMVLAAELKDRQRLEFEPVMALKNHITTYPRWIDAHGRIFVEQLESLDVFHDQRRIFTYPKHRSNTIAALYFDRNHLWLVFRYGFILKFLIDPGNPHYLTAIDSFPIDPAIMSPRSMIMDASGHLLMGTRHQGLLVLAEHEHQLVPIEHFDMRSGLTDNFVTCLLVTPEGDILVGTQTGLDRIHRTGDQSYIIENLTKRTNYFAYIQSLYTSTQGRILALTNTGLEIEVFPRAMQSPTFTPRLIIDEIRVNGVRVLQHNRTYAHDENNFIVRISAPSFIDERQVQFSYMIEGGTSEGWSLPSHEHSTIHVLNLSPNEYTLHVRATFPSTIYPPIETEYHFTIRPAWWQTTFARVGLLLLVLTASWIVMRLINQRKLERQKAVLEKQRAIQEERTRISSDLHDDLGSGLSSIRFMAEKIKRMQQAFPGTDIDRIQSTSDELTDKMNEIIWAMSEHHDTLEDLLSYTRSYAARYCDEHDLACHFTRPEQVPHIFVSGRIRRNVFLCVKEALHNIVKHAHAQNVFLDFIFDEALQVTIRDDGRGMPAETTSSGHGLRNLERRIDELGGKFSFESSNGVTIKFLIPIDAGVSSEDGARM